jgi:hypothetical protein
LKNEILHAATHGSLHHTDAKDLRLWQVRHL